MMKCHRCGKRLYKYHLLEGMPVCADDRSCYPTKKLSKKLQQLAELKAKYASED